MNSRQTRLALIVLLFGLSTIGLGHAARPAAQVQAQATPGVPAISYSAGSPITFAAHSQLMRYGFSFGPSDGHFGAIDAGDGSYSFYGTAGSTSSCAGSPDVREGAFSFSGTLDQATGSNGCTKLFGPGDGPAGWLFDANYAGGGEVLPFNYGGQEGWLMPFHGEFWWTNPQKADGKCNVNGQTSEVNCFYSGLGLAVSTDNAKTFTVVGQILQPSQPISVFTGGGTNMNAGYGSLVVADEYGRHLDNPPADPSQAYFYLFFNDLLPGAPGACAKAICMGVARARYVDLIEAALAGDPDQVAQVFHEYDGATPDPWTQPATSDTPDESGTAGAYLPLWTDAPAADAEVIYDRSFDAYLAVYVGGGGFEVRASSDLLHWSKPIGPAYTEPGNQLYYPTLIGETGDPTVGGPAPRVYVQSFPTGRFPNYNTATFESVPLLLAAGSSPR